MTFWSGERLLENRSVVTPFQEANVDANAYNLRMGSSYFRTADREGKEPQKKTTLVSGESFILPAGQFAFLVTKEKVHVPADAMAFISMRTGLKFQGLINVSGFHVDPGYSGHLIFAVFNASPAPIHLCEGDQLFKIWFAQLDRQSMAPHLYEGSGQNDISNEMVRGMSREIYSLQAMAEKIRQLEQTIDTRFAEQKSEMGNLHFTWRAIQIGVVATILVSLLMLAWKIGPEFANWVWSIVSPNSPPVFETAPSSNL